MTDPSPDTPHPLVPVHDDTGERVPSAGYDPETQRLRLKCGRRRRRWEYRWINVRRLLDIQKEER
jgi:hypothetical protein